MYDMIILSHWSTEKIVLNGQKDALSIEKLDLSHSKSSSFKWGFGLYKAI